MELVERFATPDRWITSYLPAWSSAAESAATFTLEDGLHLSLPPEHPPWCPDRHSPPLRVSAVQSGSWSGPVGSTRGQQPFRDGLTVREQQDRFEGIVLRHGRVEVECRADLAAGSMVSAWMIGMEDQPERCGEICLMEIFGSTVEGGGAAVGSGIHPFRDPALVEEFSADRRDLDPGTWHTWAIDWTPAGIDWFLDGEHVRHSDQSPDYPMLLILGVFDFPDERPPPTPVPALHVREVRCSGHDG